MNTRRYEKGDGRRTAPENVQEAWWIGRMSYFFEGLCLLLIAVPLVMAYRSIPAEDRFATSSDEGYYMKYAQAFAQDGIRSIPRALHHHFDTPEIHPFPHPGRFGFTIFTGTWLKVFPDTYRSLAHLSFMAFVLFLALSYYFSRRYLGQEFAVLYTLLLSCSPLMMASSRRILQDSLLHLFWAVPFWLFFEYLMTRRRWAFFGFCAACIVALTIKEASAFLIFFFVVAWIVFKVFYVKDLPLQDFAWVVLAPPVGAFVLYIVFLGGWGNFAALVDFVSGVHMGGPVANPGMTSYSQFGTGPWFKFLVDFLLLCPWVTILCLGYVFYLLSARKMGHLHAYGLLFLLVLFPLLSVLKFTRVIRFAMSLEIVMCLFALLALLQLLRSRNWWSFFGVQVAVLLICFSQIQFFHKVYVEMGTYDTISVWLLLGRKIIPYFYMMR